MSKKTRAITFGVFVGVFLISYTIGNTYKMSDNDLQAFLKDFQNSTEGIDSIGIFLHNASVTLPMFIPGAGAAWGAFTAWQTGAAFEAMVSTNPVMSGTPPIALLLATPFGILELGAYSIGMSRSFIVIWRIIKKNPIKKEIRPSLIEIGIAIGILIIAAFVESSMMAPQHVSLSS